MNKQGRAVSAATAPIIDEASAGYRGAQRLHNRRVDLQMVETFEATQKIDKAAILDFPSDQAIQVRLTVLEAFKCYVDSLVEITAGVGSPKLEAAAQSVGESLTSVGNTLAPTAEDFLGIAQPDSTVADGSTAASASVPIGATGNKVIATSMLALGEFLVNRKIKKELPAKIKQMDPVIEALCKILEDDIDILQKQERRDFEDISEIQTVFVQSPAAAKLDPQERRIQIATLAEIVREQREIDRRLARLRTSLVRLYLTHHALAAAAQNNNPSSLKGRLSELAAAGSDLGKFYSSLSTQ